MNTSVRTAIVPNISRSTRPRLSISIRMLSLMPKLYNICSVRVFTRFNVSSWIFSDSKMTPPCFLISSAIVFDLTKLSELYTTFSLLSSSWFLEYGAFISLLFRFALSKFYGRCLVVYCNRSIFLQGQEKVLTLSSIASCCHPQLHSSDTNH